MLKIRSGVAYFYLNASNKKRSASAIKNRSLIVMILLFLIVPIQIFGYGLGVMIAYFKRFILDHDEFTGFQKKYY